MLSLKSKPQLSQDAVLLALSFHLVQYRNNLYIPVHYLTDEIHVGGAPSETLWQVLTQSDVRRLAAQQFNTMFATDAELRSFHFMVAQSSWEVLDTVNDLMVRTPEGLRVLTEQGVFEEPDGHFIANTLKPLLNTDEAAKAEVYATLLNWLGSEDETLSLLHHLATVLAPGWSAVKYVMLLGEGRNGKGVLLGMIKRLFAGGNMSGVPRQEIAARTPMVLDLNGKLLNLVSDGPMEYIKDSGTEKSLVAGEEVAIKELYKSAPVMVQTNALFVEALNREPLARDKSSALQKRLVRYYFTNVYELDKIFEARMWSDEMVGAFLALLIDHYVQPHEAATKLALTASSQQLQLDFMLHNSYGLQFIKYCSEHSLLDKLESALFDEVVEMFVQWRRAMGDKTDWDLSSATAQLAPLFDTARKSRRINGSPRKVKIITGFKPETEQLIESLEGDEDDEDTFNLMVED